VVKSENNVYKIKKEVQSDAIKRYLIYASFISFACLVDLFDRITYFCEELKTTK